jgi:MFS family permease
VPAAVAFFVRLFIREPERWKSAVETAAPPTIGELFSPAYRALTLSGLSMALVALLMWWSCNAFIPIVASGLAARAAEAQGLLGAEATAMMEEWKQTATNAFNLGGLAGTLFTVPAAKYLGRKKMFAAYFVASAAAIMAAFGLPLDPETRLYMYFPIGLTVFGVFGAFTYYLPELYPTRLRSTGAGFCYNAGRVIAALGPFLVGAIAAGGASSLDSALEVLFWVGVIPLVGLAAMPWVIETRDRGLID